MKRSALFIATTVASITAQALEITSVESIYDTARVSEDLLITSNTVDDVVFESQLTGQPHRTSYDISTKSFSEALVLLEQTNLYPVGYFSSYPSLPVDQAALNQLTSEGVALNDSAYQAHIESLIGNIRYSGLEATSDSDLTLQGIDDASIFIHELSTSTHYQCDRSTYNVQVSPAQQPTSCAIFAVDSDINKFQSFGSVSYINDVLLTAYQNQVTAYKSGLSYTIPTSSSLNDLRINNTTTPIITRKTSGDSEVYRLNPDGSISVLSTSGIALGTYSDIQINDSYLLVVDRYSEGTQSGFCEYTINGVEITCNTELQPLPFTTSDLDQNTPNEITGYTQFITLGYDSEVLTGFIGYQGITVMPVLIDLETSELTSLTTPLIDNLNDVLGTTYVNEVRTTISGLVSTLPASQKHPGMSAAMEAEVIEDLVAKFAVSAYAEYIASGDAANSVQNTSPANIADLLLMTASEPQFIEANYIKTPIAKYNIAREPDSLELTISLPNVEAQSGVEAVIIDSESVRSEKTSDANGRIMIEYSGNGTFDIALSYPNHVFECTTVDLNSTTSASVELLAGDFNNDGLINSTDLWRYYIRYFYPSTNFDVNNDGSVNGDDLAMIEANQGAVQCDL
ncbi:MAG: hypothetical protein C9355_06295 [Thalassolituus maritimus]|uniref:Dockerin domain-containing protein n=1 Tax=Thalassolituus maritimus TaxID=484498 RepID=A0A1N7PMC7_9GAMM|nr:dockerin type I domain-containing protein [Thalassolituus maritimus]TPD54866.1 MAG: hypothetical protein C9355_06295 [Thalassolituus maritimus]SIT11728.1 hypothetical protein SAMN05421686_11091 [Thalassolituus maritimus]